MDRASFRVVKPKGTSVVYGAMVSINTKGRATFNKSASQLECFNEVRWVKILFNGDENLLGIEILEEPEGDSLQLRFNEKHGNFFLPLGGFLREIGISLPESGVNRYPVRWDEESKLVIIDLKKKSALERGKSR